jgi:DNA-3-methyladenine glycosylase
LKDNEADKILHSNMPANWKLLPTSFYERKDVVKIAKEMPGKILVTNFDNKLTAARIVEVEAYNGVADKASHAYGGRRTARTEIMFAKGGSAYVYLCYGIHHLFNIVTNLEGVPHAILVRAAEPVIGIEQMMLRCKKNKADFSLTKGPGNVSKALGIFKHHSGLNLQNENILIVDDGFHFKRSDIIASARIGVDYAQEDALLPYRFFVKDNKYVSGKKR